MIRPVLSASFAMMLAMMLCVTVLLRARPLVCFKQVFEASCRIFFLAAVVGSVASCATSVSSVRLVLG
jgi:hypothetical protein